MSAGAREPPQQAGRCAGCGGQPSPAVRAPRSLAHASRPHGALHAADHPSRRSPPAFRATIRRAGAAKSHASGTRARSNRRRRRRAARVGRPGPPSPDGRRSGRRRVCDSATRLRAGRCAARVRAPNPSVGSRAWTAGRPASKPTIAREVLVEQPHAEHVREFHRYRVTDCVRPRRPRTFSEVEPVGKEL